MSAPLYAVGDTVTLLDGAAGTVETVHDTGHPAWTVYDVRTALGVRVCFSTDFTAGGSL